MAREGGMSSQEKDALMGRVLSYIHAVIPEPPVSADGDLCILFDADGGGVDGLSVLPDALLRNIVSRLPVKDAARTAVLSRRWRPIWRSAPLVLIDTHLLPAGDDEIPKHVERADSDAVAAAVSRILAAHPGPARCVRLTCCYMSEFPVELARWLKQLSVKGVQELFLINRPWPLEALKKHMPATIFTMATLTRLYLGFWRFPDTTVLPRGAAFPCLRELALCSMVVDKEDIDFVLSRSPVLDILSIQGHLYPTLRLRVVSQSLRCVQIYASELDSVAVVDAPRLERLIVDNRSDLSCKIKIGRAPALRLFGSFEMGKDELQIGNTIIKAGVPLKPSAMLTTVEILALPVPFGVRSNAKMLPSFLRCFPNLKTLHIHSKDTTESTGRLNLKFWKESGAIECVQSHITTLGFHDFRAERSEVAFLKFFVESSRSLKVLVVEFANGHMSSMAEAKAQVNDLFSGNRGSTRCSVVVSENRLEGGAMWSFERGSEMSDPFGLFPFKSFCQFFV